MSQVTMTDPASSAIDASASTTSKHDTPSPTEEQHTSSDVQQNTTRPRHHPSKYRHKSFYNQSPPPPTNCIVLKNLDYNISIDDLEEVVRRVTTGRNEFQSITPVEDKHTGSFRGMAFVNFHTIEDATAALNELSKMVINGRKVITEYRRLRPAERKEFDKRTKKVDFGGGSYGHGHRFDRRNGFFNNRDHDRRFEENSERDREREEEFRALLLKYQNGDLDLDNETKDLVFDGTLTSYERRMVHMICDEINLGHISRYDEQGDRILHVTKDPERTKEWAEETEVQKAEAARTQKEKKRKGKENQSSDWRNSAVTKEELAGITFFKPKCAQNEATGGSENGQNSTGIRAPSYKTYVPKRQPSGPDGTTGFISRKEYASKSQPIENEEIVTTNVTLSSALENLDVNDEAPTKVDVDASSPQKDSGSASSNTGRSSHTVLNPSVPAFSPSFTPTC